MHLAKLLRRQNRALGRGLSRHGRNLFQLKSRHKHGRRRDASPPINFPTSAKELYSWSEGNVQNHFRGAAVKLLWKSEDRTFAEVLAIGGAPDGDVQGLLFNLGG